MLEYLGSRFSFTDNERFGWVYWSHIRYFFYVYSYASGAMIARSMVNMYKQDKSFVDKLLYYLQQGSNKTPKEVFADLDIDIYDEAFYEEGLEAVAREISELEDLI